MHPNHRPRLGKFLLAPPLDADDFRAWPEDEDPPAPDEVDDDGALELADEYWEALFPDDDYEPLPEEGDFWTDFDAA